MRPNGVGLGPDVKKPLPGGPVGNLRFFEKDASYLSDGVTHDGIRGNDQGWTYPYTDSDYQYTTVIKGIDPRNYNLLGAGGLLLSVRNVQTVTMKAVLTSAFGTTMATVPSASYTFPDVNDKAESSSIVDGKALMGTYSPTETFFDATGLSPSTWIRGDTVFVDDGVSSEYTLVGDFDIANDLIYLDGLTNTYTNPTVYLYHPYYYNSYVIPLQQLIVPGLSSVPQNSLYSLHVNMTVQPTSVVASQTGWPGTHDFWSVDWSGFADTLTYSGGLFSLVSYA